MAGINTNRVIVGGLLAGVVGNALDMFWNLVVLRDDMMAIAQRLGMDAQTATSFSTGLPWIIVDFVFGLVVVWNYAAVRPRLGPGPRTAILAGLVPYLCATAVVFGFTTMGLMSMSAFLKGSLASLVTTVVSSLAGAWAYTEA